MATATKWAFFFGNAKAEGDPANKPLLGGKGAGLARMTAMGLPVPAGFTISTQACAAYNRAGRKWPPGLEAQVRRQLTKLERCCGKKLGDPHDPLLVSVRSGAAMSMPGMMETILNLGLNDASVEGLAETSGNRRFALDAYRRFIMMYGSTARGIERPRFDEIFEGVKDERTRGRLGSPVEHKVVDTDMDEDDLAVVVERFKSLYQHHVSEPFPQEPYAQLCGAIDAVFDSWMADKAVTYRRVEKIAGLAGTAVNVCQMVFGNLGDDSGTGVCFTRDPSTGENVLYGEALINAQGEDVVAGVRTPLKLIELQRLMPVCYDQLQAVRAMLELNYRDMQDLEFTVERGQLYILQCRAGKRSPSAAFRIAVDQATQPLLSADQAQALVKSGHLAKSDAKRVTRPIITRAEAVARIKPVDIERLFYPVISQELSAAELESHCLGTGINAVPGAASGQVVFTAAEAEERAASGESVILVRNETSPEDVGGMHAAAGILTATGGKTSHAAVVARGWGKCCIVGCDALRIDADARTMALNGRVLRQGEALTLDGNSGRIFEGELSLETPAAPPEYDTLMGWADELRRLKVRTNADTPADARKAVEMGAEGIGLCRTEHMFFDTQERRLGIQEMIVADSSAARRKALDKLLPFQREDFLGIFEAMVGKPVTVRLLDPPLHEFLPRTETDRQLLAEHAGISVAEIERQSELLHESNPMLGHRGCRLCISFPEILEMQVRAIMEAAADCTRRGVEVLPEIMIPLTIDAQELDILVQATRKTADAVLAEAGVTVPYLVGTMIETPRAALLADRIAGPAEFFSFGTNDLTQTVMALSRDDAGRFLPEYVDAARAGIFAEDPFQTLDQDGVGQLVRMGIERGRATRRNLKIGICGEHGGEAESVAFCHREGMDYVSCSPYRVPIARLAAAQAVLDEAAPGRRRQPAARAKPKTDRTRASARRTPRRKPRPGSGGRTAKRAPVKAKRQPSARQKTRQTLRQSGVKRTPKHVAKKSRRHAVGKRVPKKAGR